MFAGGYEVCGSAVRAPESPKSADFAPGGDGRVQAGGAPCSAPVTALATKPTVAYRGFP
jgi:hypothetical protein